MGRNVLPAARRRMHNRNINPFDLLYNEPVCFRCHNYGHKTVDCKLKENKADQSVKYTGTYGERNIWRKKETSQCNLVLSVQKQKSHW